MEREIWAKLTQPFDDSAIKFKLQAKGGDMGMFVPYVDARDVVQRLNEVAGPRWHDEYELQPATIRGVNGPEKGFMARCRLTILGVTREDVGEGQFPKDAVSDALKRAAVKFGIGLHLYEGQKVWVKVDERGRPLASHEEMIAIWRGEKEQAKIEQLNPQPQQQQGGAEASERQIGYIKGLLKKAGVAPDAFLEWLKEKEGNLSKQVASEVIEDLKGEKMMVQAFLEEKGELPF